MDADEEARSDERAEEHAEHDGHDQGGREVAAAEVESGAGGGGNADHEIAGGGGDFEGQAHGLVHGDDFDGAGADAEEAGEGSGERS